ncbi:MAG: pectate lyase [Planctomycetota bacterium]
MKSDWLWRASALGMVFLLAHPNFAQQKVTPQENAPGSTLRKSSVGVTRSQVLSAMRRAGEYFRENAAHHGGYVYHYSLDLKQRWGEGLATTDQIWVQPPGTPTVGLAFLHAHRATNDPWYLNAATDAAEALVDGQLKSGGWTQVVDFDPEGDRVSDYRNRPGRGRNHSSLDDGQTQSAMLFLIEIDLALGFRNLAIHEASIVALDALLNAQFSSGGFPQVWDGPVGDHPVVQASYPDDAADNATRIKNYWDMPTINDNVPGYVCQTLIRAHEVYQDARYLRALEKLGDFLLLAQMPTPQPGWAQQYDTEMRPIWARKFEPPAVSGGETQDVISTLMDISTATGNKKYLKAIPPALAWLDRSVLPDGQMARYYELRSNRPLYMTRRGDIYRLTHDDSDLPSHYGWKVDARHQQLKRRFDRLQTGQSEDGRFQPPEAIRRVNEIVASLDRQGRWCSVHDGRRLVGQPKLEVGQRYLSSQVFSDNLRLLSEFLVSMETP